MWAKSAKALDLALAKLAGPAMAPPGSLLVLAFHGVLDTMAELDGDEIDPFQPITTDNLRELIAQLKADGYRFVTGRDIARGDAGAGAVWLTFDDGYANNLRLLPLLEESDACATIFVSTGMVERGEGYWWDTLWRLRRKAGVAPRDIALERESLKALPPRDISRTLSERLGPHVHEPPSELARPMRPEEVTAAAAHPRIEIGNHTHDHTILTVVSAAEQRAEMARCQDKLAALTGQQPISIAYPNGNATAETVGIARDLGLRIGVTCLPLRESVPPRAPLAIGRFAGLSDGRMQRELGLARAKLSLAQYRARRVRSSLTAQAPA